MRDDILAAVERAEREKMLLRVDGRIWSAADGRRHLPYLDEVPEVIPAWLGLNELEVKADQAESTAKDYRKQAERLRRELAA